MSSLQTAATPRRRGRPAQSDIQGDGLREQIVDACASVYAEQGFHGATVAHILKAANVSRPTFYKFFSDKYEVIELLVTRANQQLLSLLTQEIAKFDQPEDMIRAGVNAYFSWCKQNGALVGPIYAEINDPASPAAKARAKVIGELVELIASQGEQLALAAADPLLYDAVLRAIEHIGSGAFWPEVMNDKEIARRQTVALTLALSALKNQ